MTSPTSHRDRPDLSEAPAEDVRRPTGGAELRHSVTEAIAASVLDELAEVGYARLTMEGVARRARVGKAALYRRWPSKQDMTIELIGRISVELAEARDTGTFVGDVREMLDAIVAWCDDLRTGRIMTDLIAEARRDPALAQAMTDHIGIPRRARVGVIFDRALARGELRHGVDRELFLDVIAGIVHWRIVVRRVSATPTYLDAVTQAINRIFGG